MGSEFLALLSSGPNSVPGTVGDVEIDDLLVGDGTDLTVKDIFALTQLATSGAWGLARGAFQGYGANVGILHLSMACVFGGLGWGTISPSTQALTFAVKSSCGTT